MGSGEWENDSLWCGNILLKLEFPMIFSLASNPWAMVAYYVDFFQGRPIWQPTLTRSAFDWEIKAIASILERIGEVPIYPSKRDRRIWAASNDKSFLVKSCVGWILP